MKKIQSILLLTVIFFGGPAFASDEDDAFHAVQGMFAAMSAYDYDGMVAFGTNDYHLLENGEIWSMDDLVNVARNAEGAIERRNYFSVIRAQKNQGSVWISYWNRADLRTTDGEEISLTWLESAVVVKVGDMWKVEMLHSTRVREPKTIPDGVIMEEYVGENAFMITD